ncbi:hypothetical protein DFH07DRAFT_770700 [Mycena maculata]|uniref:Uncharacterized protein n=1 Tax=Mycena maculata TaxID=230809 RepID=A0AAD7JJV8_9AGAR|nr:hypothetical protein DFH07DRAFT_770700 [Mycena maculata]
MSLYSTIQRAVANPAKAKDVVNHLTQSRALCLAVLFGLFAFHVQSKRPADEIYVLTAILMTLCISAMYDGLDEQAFKARITSLGILGFTITNAIPKISTTALVLRALLLISHSPTIIIAQVVIVTVTLPALVQLTCELVALRLMGRAGETAVELGETVNRIATQTAEPSSGKRPFEEWNDLFFLSFLIDISYITSYDTTHIQRREYYYRRYRQTSPSWEDKSPAWLHHVRRILAYIQVLRKLEVQVLELCQHPLEF